MLSLSTRVFVTRFSLGPAPRGGPPGLPGWMVVRAGSGRIVEVGVRRPGTLGPVGGGRRELEHLGDVGEQRRPVTRTPFGAQVDRVELANPDPLGLGRMGDTL